ncbi:MAG: hypothetical protein LQ342_003345 [Letrouitia transgressa]|nr:MAG: hypothetical protein LQ342_003345 [Letrouitia transgressa]
MLIPVLSPLTALLVTTPFLTSTKWQIDFYQKETDCPESGESPSFPGTMTLVGDGAEECKGGPGYKDGGHDSHAVNVRGISQKNLIVKFYATEGCPQDSYIWATREDNCYVSGKFPQGIVGSTVDTELGHGLLNFVKVAVLDSREMNSEEQP